MKSERGRWGLEAGLEVHFVFFVGIYNRAEHSGKIFFLLKTHLCPYIFLSYSSKVRNASTFRLLSVENSRL